MIKAGNTKRGLKLFGAGVLSFSIILGAAEIAVAVLNLLSADSIFGAYSITLVALPLLALLFTFVVVLVLYITAQKSNTLIESLEKVAAGDYSVEIEFHKGDAFAKIYRNFNKMTKELSAAKDMRDGFVHDLSHEIKTPLFSIQGFANLLLEGGVDEEDAVKFLNIISSEAGRLWRLADNTLTLSKLENQQFIGQTESVRLDTQINDCIVMLQREWDEKKIEVTSDLSAVKVNGNGEMLRQVWLNLLSNAVKFTPEGGKIEVGLKKEGNIAKITVKDGGNGISPEDMPYIFDKYYRAESAKKTEGNGLGLAICNRICSLSGGGIKAENAENGGAVFTVTLPAE